VVVFAGQTGVRTTGGANLIEGVHTWNSGTTAPPCTGHGILVQAPSTRVLNAYNAGKRVVDACESAGKAIVHGLFGWL
jgi:hypothetical protein